MRDTSLDRPWTKLCQILSLTYCNRAILVPDDLPIGIGSLIGSLIEQNAAYSKAFLAEYGDNQLLHGFRNRKFAHYRNVQQISLRVSGAVKV